MSPEPNIDVSELVSSSSTPTTVYLAPSREITLPRQSSEPIISCAKVSLITQTSVLLSTSEDLMKRPNSRLRFSISAYCEVVPYTVTVSELSSNLPVIEPVARGAASLILSVFIHSSRSLCLIGLPLSSEIVTDIIFVPRLFMVFLTEPVAPLTRLTRITSAMTPIIIPSIVRKDLILLLLIDLRAILND